MRVEPPHSIKLSRVDLLGVVLPLKIVSRAVPHDCTQICEGCDPPVLRGLCLKSDTRLKC